MNPILERLMLLDASLAGLRELRKKVDPASGATISIARGPDSEGQGPEIRLETGSLEEIYKVIDAMEIAARYSRDLNLSILRGQVANAQKYLNSLEKPAS